MSENVGRVGEQEGWKFLGGGSDERETMNHDCLIKAFIVFGDFIKIVYLFDLFSLKSV